MATIQSIDAWEVLDSRGKPTLEVEVTADDGTCRAAMVPSGASTGTAEAQELRDGDPERYNGQGVLTAAANVREVLGPAVQGMHLEDQAALDARLIELDGSPQKKRLGGNAVLGVSLAAAHAAAASRKVHLYQHLYELWQGVLSRHVGTADPPRMPLPMVNMISGGLHAGGNIDFQDFLITPRGAPDYPTGLEWTVRIYRKLGELLIARGYQGRLIGDEGGYGPALERNELAAEIIVSAIEASGLVPGQDVFLALDVASTHFYDGSHYKLAATGGERLTAGAMIDYLTGLLERFPIDSIEDPLAEDDWAGWQELQARLGDKVCLIGDDLFATNPQRVQRGIDEQAAGGVLVKVNQIGTLSETFETMALARGAGLRRVVSARSGETEDTTIADLAVGTAAEQIKIGSIVRSERLAKYNQLLRIQRTLGG